MNSFSELSYDYTIKFKDCLKELKIRNCNLKTGHLRILSDCPNLIIFDGFNNNFNLTETSFTLGCSKNSLKDINLGFCSLSEDCLIELTDCPSLEKLQLRGNNFSDISENFKFGRFILNLIKLKKYGKFKIYDANDKWV